MSVIFAALSFISPKGWLVLGAVAAIGIAAGVFYHSAYQSGEQSATTAITRANDAAGHEFDKGASAVDRCYDSGGRWDRFSGVCNAGPGK